VRIAEVIGKQAKVLRASSRFRIETAFAPSLLYPCQT